MESTQPSQNPGYTGSVKVVWKVWRRVSAPQATKKKDSVPADQSRKTPTLLDLGGTVTAEFMPLFQVL